MPFHIVETRIVRRLLSRHCPAHSRVHFSDRHGSVGVYIPRHLLYLFILIPLKSNCKIVIRGLLPTRNSFRLISNVACSASQLRKLGAKPPRTHLRQSSSEHSACSKARPPTHMERVAIIGRAETIFGRSSHVDHAF
jgi:hypothetical protein